MNEIYYYLIISVFLYFLFSRLLDKYINQENFDPSLVPISSIVNLAKISQKIVNGNGTLTNPGNLQIGLGNGGATGNLRVTGSSTVGSITDGSKTFNVIGTADVSGATTLGGTLGVTGATTLSTLNTTGDTTIGSTTNGTKKFNVVGTAGVSGDTAIGGNLTVTGDTILTTLSTTGKTTIGTATASPNTLNVAGSVGISGATVISGTLGAGDTTLSKVTVTNDTTIGGTLGVAGDATITGTLTVGGIVLNTGGQFRLVLQGGSSKDKCLTANADDSINLQTCTKNDNQYWYRTGGRFISKSNKKCITITVDNGHNNPATITKLAPINPTNEYQMFSYVSSGKIVSNVLGGVNNVRTLRGGALNDGKVDWYEWGVGMDGQWWMI